MGVMVTWSHVMAIGSYEMSSGINVQELCTPLNLKSIRAGVMVDLRGAFLSQMDCYFLK